MNPRSLTVRYILIVLLMHLVVMFFLQEILLISITDAELKHYARISSVFTICISTAFMFITIGIIIILPYIFLSIFNTKVKYDQYYLAPKNLLYSYMYYEGIRLIIISLFVYPAVKDNIGNMQFIETFYTLTKFGQILLSYDLIYIPIATLIYGITYYCKVSKSISETIVVSTILLLAFCLLNIKNFKTIIEHYNIL